MSMRAEVVIIVLGFVTVVLVMALIMNPPEALVKKFYHRKPRPDSPSKPPTK